MHAGFLGGYIEQGAHVFAIGVPFKNLGAIDIWSAKTSINHDAACTIH